MIPNKLLPYYTHLSETVDDEAGQIVINPASFFDANNTVDVRYSTVNQQPIFKYQVGASAVQEEPVSPPYRYVYGINRLQENISRTYTGTLPEHSSVDYPESSVAFTELFSVPTAIANRSANCDVTAAVSGVSGETIYIGNFTTYARRVIYTNNPLNINDPKLEALFRVTNEDASVYYEPGVDYIFDANYQSIQFTDVGLAALEPKQVIVVTYASANSDEDYVTVTSNSTVTLPTAGAYCVGITGAQASSYNITVNITWTSTIDSTQPNSNYVLALADETGYRRLASSGSDNVTVQDVEVITTKAVFTDFTDAIRTSTAATLNDTKLDALVSFSNCEIYSSSLDSFSESRLAVYDQTVTNPVELATETDFRVDRRQPAQISDADNLYLAVTKLPNRRGRLYAGLNALDNSMPPEDMTSTSEVLVPGLGGLLGRSNISEDMYLADPTSAAWGLLLAASYHDVRLCLLGLKELIYQAKQREWIVLQEGVYIVNDQVAAGLPIHYHLLDDAYVESFKEVGSNAFLGYAACIAILCITDDELDIYYALEGSTEAFKTELLVTLEALALFVANGVSPVTWLCAYKEESDYYSYDTPTVTGTVYADLFLSYFLTIKYQSKLHYVAAKLKTSVNNLPLNLDAVYYEQFVERDYLTVQHPLDLTYLNMVDDSIAATYSLLSIAAALSLRAYILNDLDVYDIHYVNYSNYLQSLEVLADDNNVTLDNIASLSVIASTITIDYTPPTTYLEDYIDAAITTPVEVNSYPVPSTVNISQLAAHKLQTYAPLATHATLLEIGEVNALATATAALLEVRRMMPFGIKWFSEERVNDTSSIIGSLLYAESEIYYRTGLSIYALETERSPLTAKFDAPQKWFNAFFQVPSIGSEVFLKRLINLFLNFNSTDLAVYIEFLNNFFNIESTLTFPRLPDFLAYDFETSNLDYVYVGNTRLTELAGSNVKSLTAGEYYSINFKLVDKEWIARRVPGLPVFLEDVTTEYEVVTADQFLANPKLNHVVQDGEEIGIFPLLNYVMRASIDLDNATPYLLEWINNTLLPAGLLITYTTTTLLAGD